MIRVTFLGTSGSTPTKERNLPAVALEYEGDTLLFDCGEGTQRQMMRYGVNMSKVRAIFVSHMHGDHFFGIAGFLRSLGLNGRKENLDIFVPEGYEKAMSRFIGVDVRLIGYKVNVHGVKAGVVYKGEGYTVSAFRLLHTVPTYGYIFKEDDSFNFVLEKAKKLGLKGTMFGQLAKKGRMTINGKSVRLANVIRVKPGRKVVYATDTRPAAATARASKGADILIHEATYDHSLKVNAVKNMHSTAYEAARIAKKAEVKKLVLFHVSARYQSTDTLLKEARKVFNGTSIAEDGTRISI